MANHRETPKSAAMALPPQKIRLTSRFVESRNAAMAATVDHYHDSIVPGMALRVTDTGSKSFVLLGRFPANPKVFTRLSMGRFPTLTLNEARTKARKWQGLVERGLDPRHEEERERAAMARETQITVAAVFEDFVREKLVQERKGAAVARELRKDLLPRLGSQPIAQVERLDVRELIKAKRTSAPAQARNLLGYVKRFFAWAVDQELYGLKASPCGDIRAAEIIGPKKRGERVLSDDEMFALWRAVAREPFPYRQAYQLLILNALRLNEAVDAAWSEFEFGRREWTVPATRMKGRNGQARQHLVPLTAWSLRILGQMPELTEGPYLFSCNFGKSPVWMGSKVKQRLDARMRRTLRALARKAGRDPERVELAPWVNHDIRRTIRTNLSSLRTAAGFRIPDEVKESVIAHVRPGIKGVYDKYEYADEKFEALDLWNERLAQIIGRSA
jgi:integrase